MGDDRLPRHWDLDTAKWETWKTKEYTAVCHINIAVHAIAHAEAR